MKSKIESILFVSSIALGVLATIFALVLSCQPLWNICLEIYGRAQYPEFVEVTKQGYIVEGRNVHGYGRHYYGVFPTYEPFDPDQRTTGTTEDGQVICPADLPPVGGKVDPGWDDAD